MSFFYNNHQLMQFKLEKRTQHLIPIESISYCNHVEHQSMRYIHIRGLKIYIFKNVITS